MKTVLMDASSAILLHKSELLPQVVVAFDICLTDSVYAELTRHRRPGARAITRSRREGQLTIVAPPPAGEFPSLPANLHRGERDTLLRFLGGGGDFIIIDDGPGAGYCRRQEIPYVNALLCPRILAAAGRLTPSAARSAMLRIAGLGRYGEGIKRYALTCEDLALIPFLP